MKYRVLFRVCLAGFGAAALAGCGGGGSSSGGGSADALSQGRAAISGLASGTTQTNQQTLQSILNLFNQAIQQNPHSSEAHFGFAVCLAGQVAQEIDNAGATDVPPSPPVAPGKPGSGVAPTPPLPPAPLASAAGKAASLGTSEVPPTPPNQPAPQPLPPQRTLGLFWNLGNSLASPYVLLRMLAPVADLRLGFVPFYGYPQDDVARRQKMLDDLKVVSDNLSTVESDPTFSVSLPDADANGKMVTVGLPEVYLFDAYVQSLRAELALSLAYVRDPGTVPVVVAPDSGVPVWSGATTGSTPPVIAASLDKNHDGKLTPDEYLPPSPYLTLRDAKLLQTAQQSILAVADREQKGIAGVFARPADGAFLIPNVPAVQKVLTNIRDNVIPVIRQAASGPFTIDVPFWAGLKVDSGGGAGVSSDSKRGNLVFEPRDSTVVGGGGSGTGSISLPQMKALKVDLAAWFTNPPPDLKAFAPTLTLNSQGWPDPSKTVYPDKTFGGLFPDGITIDLPF